MAEQRFELRGGKRLKARTFVVVTDDAVEVKSPFLKEPIALSHETVAHVIRMASRESVTDVYAGDPRRFELAPPAAANAVVLVLAQPVFVDSFTHGAEKVLPITAKERRHGIDVDVISVPVDDPDALAASIAAHGAQPGESLASAMRGRFGLASPEDAAAVRRKDRRGLLLAWVMVALASAAMLGYAAVAADLADDDPIRWNRLIAGVVAAGAAGLFSWQVVLRRPERPDGELGPSQGILGFVGAVWTLGVVFMIGWGSAPPILLGVWLAAPVGLFAGYLQRLTRNTASANGDAPGEGPVDQPV